MSKVSIGIPLFPGTNCHEESQYAVQAVDLGGGIGDIVLFRNIIEGRTRLLDYDGLFLVGGFSWGDHYGSGRIAGLVMRKPLHEFAATGRPIFGVCNGFQIMMEAGLFNGPEGESGGALVQNTSCVFESRWTRLRPESGSPWTAGIDGDILHIPSAHGEGRWLPPAKGAHHLKRIFRFCDSLGNPTEDYPGNPNGSPEGITGLAYNNIAGMMPHPERAMLSTRGSTDGRRIIENFIRLARQKG